MDYDTPDFLLPGAAYDFHDVTELFEEAASGESRGVRLRFDTAHVYVFLSKKWNLVK